MKKVKAENGMDAILDYLLSGKGEIERQEARGQQSLVNSDTLPIDMRGDIRQVLKSAGVIFGEPADDLFQFVTLPAGWKKVPTDHAMWSNLIDDKGEVKARIFYKAAFYDRSAFIA